MTQTRKVKNFEAMGQEERNRLNQFLKRYGLSLEGGSHVKYNDDTEVVFIGFEQNNISLSRKQMGEDIKKEFGYKNLIVEGIEI